MSLHTFLKVLFLCVILSFGQFLNRFMNVKGKDFLIIHMDKSTLPAPLLKTFGNIKFTDKYNLKGIPCQHLAPFAQVWMKGDTRARCEVNLRLVDPL